MTLQSAIIPGFNNGISQQAATSRRPDQGASQVNGIGTLVDGLLQRPGTEFLSVLTSNAENGVFMHAINRDTDDRYVVLFTGDATEPIEIYDLTGTKQTVQYGTLDADGGSYAQDDTKKAYALPWSITNSVANGTFDADTDWTKGDGWTISGGKANCNGTQVATSYLQQASTLTVGKYYRCKVAITNYSAGTFKFLCGSGKSGAARSANGIYEEILQCTSDTTLYGRADSTFVGKIDNVEIMELDAASNPSEIFKAVTVADNTFVVNTGITCRITADVDGNSIDDTVQTFADLPATPADEDIAKITGDDTGFDDWYVTYAVATDVWSETIGPGESLGTFQDVTMPYRLVHTGTSTFTFAPCIYQSRTVGDVNSTPTPSFVDATINNVFFYKNRLSFLSNDNVIMSRDGEYFNFYTATALDVLDSDPIDVSATAVQVEQLRSVAVFDKSIIILADNQQFDFGSGEGALTPTTVAITPTTKFNICPLCEPITAGPNVYFVNPKTDFTAIREYYVQPDSLLNDAADITAHVPQYIPMGHIQMSASNVLDMILVHTDANPDSLYLYKYFWSGDQKAQAAWSRWDFGGDVLGHTIIGTTAYLVIADSDTSQIVFYKMELETTTTGALSFRVHADQLQTVTGVYDSTLDRTTWTTGYQMLGTEDMMAIIHPTTGRPLVEAAIVPWGADVVTNGAFAADTDWNKGTCWTIAGGVADCDGTQVDSSQTLNQTGALTLGVNYRVVYTLTNVTAGSVQCLVGTGTGTARTVNGTFEEEITCAGTTTIFFVPDADFVGEIDNVKIYPAATNATKLEVTGDKSDVAYHICKKYEMSHELTTWYLKDQNGAPKLQGRLQVRTLTLNFTNTGYFTVEVAAAGRSTMTHIFSGAVIGVSTIGEVNLITDKERFTIRGKNTAVTVTIKTDSYLPVAFQSGSWEGLYYPRGRE